MQNIAQKWRATMSMEAREVGTVISFADVYFASQTFENLLRNGLALVEETATYLEGAGKEDAAKLATHSLKSVYSTESMRLTTRLMQSASWLIRMRSRKEQVRTTHQTAHVRERMNLNAVGTSEKVFELPLPGKMLELIRRSLTLIEEIRRLDSKFFPARR